MINVNRLNASMHLIQSGYTDMCTMYMQCLHSMIVFFSFIILYIHVYIIAVFEYVYIALCRALIGGYPRYS